MKLIKVYKIFTPYFYIFLEKYNQDDRIRTCDLLFPKQERYQTALHLD